MISHQDLYQSQKRNHGGIESISSIHLRLRTTSLELYKMFQINENKITGLIVSFWLIFFLFQIAIANEAVLTFIATAGIAATVLVLPKNREKILLGIGILLGILVEVGLGLILRQQHWEQASFLGVPLWLPLIWGMGFIAIRRLGNIIVGNVLQL